MHTRMSAVMIRRQIFLWTMFWNFTQILNRIRRSWRCRLISDVHPTVATIKNYYKTLKLMKYNRRCPLPLRAIRFIQKCLTPMIKFWLFRMKGRSRWNAQNLRKTQKEYKIAKKRNFFAKVRMCSGKLANNGRSRANEPNGANNTTWSWKNCSPSKSKSTIRISTWRNKSSTWTRYLKWMRLRRCDWVPLTMRCFKKSGRVCRKRFRRCRRRRMIGKVVEVAIVIEEEPIQLIKSRSRMEDWDPSCENLLIHSSKNKK